MEFGTLELILIGFMAFGGVMGLVAIRARKKADR